MWREAGKLGMCFSVVPNRNIKAMFSPADKDAALKYILHLSNTQYVINKTKQQKKKSCQLLPYSEETTAGVVVPPWSTNTSFPSAPSLKWCNILQLCRLMK